MTLEEQIQEHKKLVEKSRKITNFRYRMTAEDRANLIYSFINKVREYNSKYQTKFNLSRRPDLE